LRLARHEAAALVAGCIAGAVLVPGVAAKDPDAVAADPDSGYASRGTSGGHYTRLGGHGLPNVPVFSMQRVPGHHRQILAATLGRGVYRYTFPGHG
jgi:hypothetical protein